MTEAEIRNLIGKVNANEIKGKKVGHLLVTQIIKGPAPNSLTLIVTEDTVAPWNYAIDRKTNAYRLILDSKGKPLYEAVEFPPESDEIRYEIRKR